MSAPGPSKAPLGRRWSLLVLELGLLAWAFFILWVSVGEGTEIELGFGRLSLHRARNPLNLLAAGILLDLWLREVIQPVLRAGWARLRAASLPRQAGMLLSLALVAPVLDRYLQAPAELPPEGLRYSGLFDNDACRHVTDLVYQVVSRPDNRPPVVYVQDDDPRAHYASYYCYPRTIKMEPGMRRWSMVAHTLLLWAKKYIDPGFAVDPWTPAPDLQASREWAAALGTDLLVTPGHLPWQSTRLGALLETEWVSPAFVPMAEIAGLQDAEPARALAWADADGDGYPDLSLESWSGGRRVLYRSHAGLYFERDPAASSPGIPRPPGQSLPLGDARLSSLRALVARPTDSPSAVEQRLAAVALGDVDGDGNVDALAPAPGPAGGVLLLLDRGDGVLVDATAGSGLEMGGDCSGCVLGDVDGDGSLDALLLGEAGLRLLRGQAGRFVDITEAAGVGGIAGRLDARLADVDNDGWLDLLVSSARAVSEPGRPKQLLRNRGDGTFREVSQEAGLPLEHFGEFSRIALCDYDRDGYLDIAFSGGSDARQRSAPTLLRNRGGSRGSLALRVVGERGETRGAACLRVLSAGGAVRLRATSELLGQGGSEALAHVGLGQADAALEVELVRLDGTCARIQGVPAGSLLELPASPAPGRLIGSHPAALTGEVDSFDLAAAEARAQRLLAGSPWPDADADDLARRGAEVLAWLEARRREANVRIDDLEVARVFEQGRRLSLLPGRHLLDLTTLGPLPGDAEAPESDAVPFDERSSGETRWVSTAFLERALGERGRRLAVQGDSQEFEAPAELADPELLAGPGGRLTGFRLLLSEPSSIVERKWIESSLRHSLRLAGLQAAFAQGGEAGSGRFGYLQRVRYDVGSLAAAARSGGLDRTAAGRSALARVAREAVLDRVARDLVQRYQPSGEAIAARSTHLLPLWSSASPATRESLVEALAVLELRRDYERSVTDELLGWGAR